MEQFRYQAGYGIGGISNTCVGFMSCKDGTTNNTALGYQSGMSVREVKILL